VKVAEALPPAPGEISMTSEASIRATALAALLLTASFSHAQATVHIGKFSAIVTSGFDYASPSSAAVDLTGTTFKGTFGYNDAGTNPATDTSVSTADTPFPFLTSNIFITSTMFTEGAGFLSLGSYHQGTASFINGSLFVLSGDDNTDSGIDQGWAADIAIGSLSGPKFAGTGLNERFDLTGGDVGQGEAFYFDGVFGDNTPEFAFTITAAALAPEPASAAMVAAGLLGLGLIRRKRCRWHRYDAS
jgi:hypothetical protein